MELLRRATASRLLACERARLEVRSELAEALTDVLPKGTRLWVYGSLVAKDRFREWSDVDLALEHDPPGMSIHLLSSELAERVGRSVDVCLLSETRLATVIQQRGELWIV